MSEKKSWDIQPNSRRSGSVPQRSTAPIQRAQSAPARTAAPVPRAQTRSQQPPQRTAPRTEQAQRVAPPRVSARDARKRAPQVTQATRKEKRNKNKLDTRDQSLKGRRRRARRRAITASLILLVVIVGGAFGSLWWTGIRIETIAVSGPDADAMKSIAQNDLVGTYHFIIPRNSIFFLPKNQIRTDILKQYPDISALTISRISFNAISIVSIPRQAALIWCGESYDPNSSASNSVFTDSNPTANSSSTSDTTASADSPGAPPCYSADAQGVIFAMLPSGDTSSADSLRIYAPLSGTADPSEPLGASIAEAAYIPNALQFVKVIKSLNVPIITMVLRGDEVDLYAQSGTRITYVLGHEEETAQVAQAAFPSLNINNGSLEYVDLRFAGKAYYKPVGAYTSSTATST